MPFGLSLILHPANSFKKGKVPIVKQMLPVMVRSVYATKYTVLLSTSGILSTKQSQNSFRNHDLCEKEWHILKKVSFLLYKRHSSER